MQFQTLDRDIAAQADLAVLFASFEGRCVRVAEDLCAAGFHGKALVLYCRDTATNATRRNVSRLTRLLDRCQVLPVEYEAAVTIVQVAASLRDANNVIVDASCFNRANLFPFLWATGWGRTSFPKLVFGYSPPLRYGSWLTRDYEKPTNFIGFGGAPLFADSRLLIAAVGYERDRAIEVIRAVEPTRVYLAVGTVPTRTEFLERNRIVVREILGSKEYEVLELDVVNPSRCFDTLNNLLLDLRPRTAVHVAPFSTKLSCLGIWALWLANPGIRLWNARPRYYNVRGYSKGAGVPVYYSVNWDQIGVST